VRKFSDPALKKCPTCGRPIQKLASAPAIQFKGSGWYITDYARKSPGDGKGDKGETGEKKDAPAKETKDSSAKDSSAKDSSAKDSSSAGKSATSSKKGAGTGESS
jgi:predicted nucleic acid-binding Zn ribbon protein